MMMIYDDYPSAFRMFRDDTELEAEMRRKMEQQLAIEQQLAEKRRLEKLTEQREHVETERLERERRALEARQQREDDLELNKWKQQMVSVLKFFLIGGVRSVKSFTKKSSVKAIGLLGCLRSICAVRCSEFFARFSCRYLICLCEIPNAIVGVHSWL